LIFNTVQLSAQHCAPIVESYLSTIDITRSEEGLNLSLKYSKTGGRTKSTYQAYILAYSDKNRAKVLELTAQEAIAEKLVTVLHTQAAKQNEEGNYEIEFKLNTQNFVERLLKEKQISLDSVTDTGGWKSFDSPIRLALFIPFLDDKQFSRIDGLPEDKHECNYGNKSALFYDSLSTQLQICFGIVQATRLREGEYFIQMNCRQPK
jgi:hypothetical protein